MAWSLGRMVEKQDPRRLSWLAETLSGKVRSMRCAAKALVNKSLVRSVQQSIGWLHFGQPMCEMSLTKIDKGGKAGGLGTEKQRAFVCSPKQD